MIKHDPLPRTAERATGLRQQARRMREYAQYADGQAYYQDLREADYCDQLADEIEREIDRT